MFVIILGIQKGWSIFMDNRLNVLYQFDDKYAPYAGISITSLYENNKGIENLNVFCAAMDISNENLVKLKETARKYRREIHFLDTRDAVAKIKDLNVGSWNGSLATWIKIFIIKDLIDDLDSLLYVDSDTLILGSLQCLCDFDFDGKAMACVVDSLSFEHIHRLKIEQYQYYYNAGVMYFNLAYFRKHQKFYSNMICCVEQNAERYIVNDQDLLNDYFKGNIKTLSPKFNLQGTHYMYTDDVYFRVYKKYDYYTSQDIANAKNDVRILHFFRELGDYPWEEGNRHPLSGIFEEWQRKSLWADLARLKKKRSCIFRIERLLFRIMPRQYFLMLFKAVTNI